MAFNANTIQQLGLNSTTTVAPKKQSLGQDQFLKLMTTQMTHQDPTKPMDNAAFLSQMAQFSTVEGVKTLNDSFKSFSSSMTSNQALQASGLVGRSVAVPSDQGVLALDKPLIGSVNLSGTTLNAKVNILDQQGTVVKQLDLGSQSAGSVKFSWDGQLDDGSYATPGLYQLKAEANIGGKNTGLDTYVSTKVESVDLGNAKKGVVLNLGQLGSIPFSQVKQVF